MEFLLVLENEFLHKTELNIFMKFIIGFSAQVSFTTALYIITLNKLQFIQWYSCKRDLVRLFFRHRVSMHFKIEKNVRWGLTIIELK